MIFNSENKAEIGIIGGSGFYDLASNLKDIKVETPYGSPSGKISIGEIAGKKVAFLPRHGKEHDITPHKINYRANIWALKYLGVESILTSHAAGSLQKKIKPGDFVVMDQFVDRTNGRPDTFFDGPIVTHISTAFPYCPILRKLAYRCCKNEKARVHPKGTIVVIQGPRFSTAAESVWFTKMGWDVVNMTEYPEVSLAREMEMCYCAIAIATDYDAGLIAAGDIKPVSVEEILKNFKSSMKSIKSIMLQMVKKWPLKFNCECRHSLQGARFS